MRHNPKKMFPWAISGWSYRRAELEIVGDHRSYDMAGEAKEMRGQEVPNILSFFCPWRDRKKHS